jgi:hypothetical protein
MKQVISKILEIITIFLSNFFNKKKVEKLELINKIEEKKQQVDFQSEIEKIAKNAESSNLDTKNKAIEDMRKLISE